MLEEIRLGLEKSAPFEHLYHHLQPSPRASRPSIPEISRQELADRFSSELLDVGGEVHRVTSKQEGLATLGTILLEINAKRVTISDLDLLDGNCFEKVDLIAGPSREDLFTVDAGITAAQLAVAETGTLVLRSSAERHRLVSLVPPVHICLLRADDIRPTILSVLEETSSGIDPAITFITGPSRTSDIELTLAIGVHGPKRLIVVLFDQYE
jgi:L-lactate dehydrogenase complex protein LldG